MPGTAGCGDKGGELEPEGKSLEDEEGEAGSLAQRAWRRAAEPRGNSAEPGGGLTTDREDSENFNMAAGSAEIQQPLTPAASGTSVESSFVW